MTRDDDKSNIIDLSKQRKKQRTIHRSGASRGTKKEPSKVKNSPSRWNIIAQTAVFIGLIWLTMRSCGG